MSYLVQNAQIFPAFVPVDISGATHQGLAANALWVNMENYNHCSIVLITGIGTAGDDYTATLRQATDNAGTGAKALNFEDHWYRQGAVDIEDTAVFTHTSVSATNTFTDADDAENETMLVLEVDAEDLDADGGFTHIQLSVDDVGTNAQLACALYILTEPRYGQDVNLTAID